MYTENTKNNLCMSFCNSTKRFGDRVALEVNKETYTYRNVYRMTARLSEVISSLNNIENDLVALCAYRSEVAYIGALSILVSGCGYVPLNPEFPLERNIRMLIASGTNVMIVGKECQDALDKMLKSVRKRMIFILIDYAEATKYQREIPEHEFILVDEFRAGNDTDLKIKPVEENDIAYLLFTSGSTGEPKGVPVSHRNVKAYLKHMSDKFGFNECDRFSQMHDMTFDLSVHDIFLPWEVGACVCVASFRDKLLPVSYIQKSRITSWLSVPSIAAVIDRYGRLTPGAFPELRHSFFCGEALPESLAEKWQLAANNSQVVNLYGPTEATIAFTAYIRNERSLRGSSRNGIVPIGKVFEGQLARIIREDGHQADVEEAGELCLSGSQVTQGYWNNIEKTKAQYVTLPGAADALWYKTGDLAQLDKDGCIHYLGRLDDQVKIMGNRVELGEIDRVLREAINTEEAIAMPWPELGAGVASGIVAFVCRSDGRNEKPIVEHCRDRLPKYMVPTKIHFIDKMPLNSNGKIDRKQLRRLLEEG